MNAILKELTKVYYESGETEAKIELTRHSDAIAAMQGADWVAFKAEVSKFFKVSEADYKEIRKQNTVKITRSDDWSLALTRDKQGEVRTGLRNCSVAISEHPALEGGIGFNGFLQRPCFLKNMPFMPEVSIESGGYAELDGTKLAQISVWLAHNVQEFTEASIIKSITEASMRNSFNPLVEKLVQFNTEWDQKPRLDNWLFDYLNAEAHDNIDEQEEKKYIKRVGAMWMIGAVARAFEAGCKVDTMLILEGEQGDGKSSLLNELSLGYFLELTTSLVRSKDVVDSMLGKWIVELPELKALSGDTDSNKAFLTKQTDKERLSYERFGKDFPRRCIFIGTTNEDRYLKDLTGNRRFWPVKVGRAEKSKLKEDLAQLWGEAVQRYSDGERWWMDNEEDKDIAKIAGIIQGMKQDYDESQDDLEAWLEGMKHVKSSFVWSNFFKGSQERFGKPEQMRVAKVMRSCGWKRSTKGTERVWRCPE